MAVLVEDGGVEAIVFVVIVSFVEVVVLEVVDEVEGGAVLLHGHLMSVHIIENGGLHVLLIELGVLDFLGWRPEEVVVLRVLSGLIQSFGFADERLRHRFLIFDRRRQLTRDGRRYDILIVQSIIRSLLHGVALHIG